jgi:hypothetical protein
MTPLVMAAASEDVYSSHISSWLYVSGGCMGQRIFIFRGMVCRFCPGLGVAYREFSTETRDARCADSYG